MSYEIGDVWSPQLTVTDTAGALTAATVAVTVTSPTGAATSPAVTNPSLGVYTTTVALSENGQWTATWTVSGAVTGVESQYADVRAGNGGVTLARVKKALGITVADDDDELQDLIDEALSYYESLGFALGGGTVRLSGGHSSLYLPLNATRVTAASYTDGTVIDVADLVFTATSGKLGWGYNTAGVFTYGTDNLLVSYAASVPAHHRREIISDIAGYWTATQRGNGSGGALPVDGYSAPYATPSAPLTSFPRIAALAAPFLSVA